MACVVPRGPSKMAAPAMPIHYRDLIKRLMLLDFDLLGSCNVHELATGETHSVKFSDAEKKELGDIQSEAFTDWLTRGADFASVEQLRWVACETCGGSGEIILGEAPDQSNDLCSACDGTGRDCVAVSPITVDDLDQPAR